MRCLHNGRWTIFLRYVDVFSKGFIEKYWPSWNSFKNVNHLVVFRFY